MAYFIIPPTKKQNSSGSSSPITVELDALYFRAYIVGKVKLWEGGRRLRWFFLN